MTVTLSDEMLQTIADLRAKGHFSSTRGTLSRNTGLKATLATRQTQAVISPAEPRSLAEMRNTETLPALHAATWNAVLDAMSADWARKRLET